MGRAANTQYEETLITDNTAPKKRVSWNTFKIFSHSRNTKTQHPKSAAASRSRKSWTPPALHPLTLSLVVLVSLTLIITLQLFLDRSNRNQGVIFAPSIGELPLSKTFMYRYFPTIVAVIYSIFWAWIDLEAKRVEPWYRLSTEGGSTGKDSMLLTYPFDFAPFVPFRAMKRRHWPVFWASFALLLVTWGLVPVQAGIFSTRPVVRERPMLFNVSTDFVPAAQQPQELSLAHYQSTYAIATLDERLPPYMASNYTLAPFEPSSTHSLEVVNELDEWTATTTLYSLDLACEPTFLEPGTLATYKSSWGCNFTVGLDGNVTEGTGGSDFTKRKRYSALWAAFAPGSDASYRINYCPPGRAHTFYAGISENKVKEEDPPNNVSAIFCEVEYYMQDVNATIEKDTKQPLRISTLSPKRPLPEQMFNRTSFQQQLSSNTIEYRVRRDFSMPGRDLPEYGEQILDSELSALINDGGVSGLALALDKRPLRDSLDWRMLKNSYETAYQLMFSRAMVEILGPDTTKSRQTEGNERIMTEALILEPIFTYIVEGFLGAVSVFASVLLYLSINRFTALRSDPSTIASLMSLVSDNPNLLASFKDLDCSTITDLETILRDKSYRLIEDPENVAITEIVANRKKSNSMGLGQRRGFTKDINHPVRPKGFSLWAAISFVGLFVILAAALIAVFLQARVNGLSLPSNSRVGQKILENYIPTLIVMMIEPMWILLNRHICLLQPIEQLWRGNAKAEASIDVNYSSLPPQLVIWKSLKVRHLILAAICSMALLSNVLAVAFAGLFHHEMTEVRIHQSFQPPFDATFVSINGSVSPSNRRNAMLEKPSGAYRAGKGQDQFLIAESNYTRNTLLPAWTDDALFYLPFRSNTLPNISNISTGVQYEAQTRAFGAELKCSALEQGSYRVIKRKTEFGMSRLMVALSNGKIKADCVSSEYFRINPNPTMVDESTGGTMEDTECINGPSAAELVYNMEPAGGANASQAQRDICWATAILGWVRSLNGSCGTTPEHILASNQSFLVQCTPQMVRGHGTVRVDEGGRLLRPVHDRFIERNLDLEEVKANFSNDPINLINQSNRYMFYSWTNPWHNDSIASDFMSYFVRVVSNSSRLLDPTKSLPKLEEVQIPLNRTYSRLFAIWLGANHHKLFVNASGSSTVAWRIEKEERLFISSPLFIVSLSILLAYMVVAIIVYLRRPGRFLPRLPTSIASIIGLFAASTAVHDMRGTSRYSTKERARYLKDLETRYGYGNFVGTDGNIHVGIEKTPFVTLRHGVHSRKPR
ncbi:unnamed protein product [Periconia digitata]|uniref:Uncharacterized protein n=1 Tax=Periconia digitata TaxID=1303443 RepID=A0A9W4XLP7_9PLEO|nr:unnamed protein product [Periconia digitata]